MRINGFVCQYGADIKASVAPVVFVSMSWQCQITHVLMFVSLMGLVFDCEVLVLVATLTAPLYGLLSDDLQSLRICPQAGEQHANTLSINSGNFSLCW